MNTPDTQQLSSQTSEQRKSNLDRSATVGFCTVAGVGFFATLNNIREKFDEGFVKGWGRVKTPFSRMITDYEKLQQSNLAKYEASSKTMEDAERYRHAITTNAKNHRTAIAEMLESKFNIPTNGLTGWTVGTGKRFMHLGNKTKAATGATAIGLGVVTWVGYAILRHTKYTLDAIDTKLDNKLDKIEQRGR